MKSRYLRLMWQYSLLVEELSRILRIWLKNSIMNVIFFPISIFFIFLSVSSLLMFCFNLSVSFFSSIPPNHNEFLGFQFIIMDGSMAEFDRYEFIKAVKKEANLPVVGRYIYSCSLIFNIVFVLFRL